MVDPEHFRRLERMYRDAPISLAQGATIEVSEGVARVTIPVRAEFYHAADAVHGSLYFRALDDAAFFAANSLVPDAFVLTTSFNIHFLRPVAEGELIATGRVAHQSRRLIVAEAELVSSAGHVLARGSGSFMKSRMPLDESIGYR